MSIHEYFTDDCTFSVPAGFNDRTMNMLEWKTPEGDSIALAVQRERLPGLAPEETPSAADLEQYAAAQTRDYPAQLAGFHLERDEVDAGEWGFRICRKAFRFLKDRDVLYHHQAFVLAGDHVVVITAGAKARHRAQVDLVLDDVLASFRVRGD